MQYTTLENLKAFLGISCNDEDTILRTLIAKGSDMLSTELGDDLGLKTVTKRYDSYGTNRVVLENIPNSVASVEYTTNNGYTWNTVDVDFIDGYTVYLRDKIPTGYKNVKITFQKGYASVPGDLETFFMKYVSKMRDERTSATRNKDIKTKKSEDLSITYFGPNEMSGRDDAFSQDYDMIKNKYRVFSFPVTI